MRKIVCLSIIVLSILSCSNSTKLKYCSPIKAVELLINHPRIADSKTETGYYEISNEDDKSIYLGYTTLNLKLERTLNPYYFTDKKEFYSIIQKTSDIDIWKAESIVKNWYLEKYPELNYDSIKTSQTINISFSHNKTTDKYDARCFGWIDFYRLKMEKSTEPNIDSVMNHYSLKKINYRALIKDGKKIDWIKNE